MSHSSIFSRAVFLSALLFVAGSALFGGAVAAHATSLPIQGYAWSDFLGWIHFNGSGYGVYEDSSTGALSGYAWSPYFGWISFNSSDGSHPAPMVSLTTGNLSGWALSCAAFLDKNTCSGSLDIGSGGWDGWIHLAGSNYGITSSNGCWSGYAYGSQNIGFIKFAGTALDGFTYKVGNPSCAMCVNGAVNPPACTTCANGATNPPTCTIPCTNGAIDPPTCVTCSSGQAMKNGICTAVSAPVVTLSASPSSVVYNGRSTITWSSTDATSCVSGGPWSTSGNLSGSGLTDPLTSNTTFTLQCTGPGGTSPLQSVTVIVGVQTCLNGADNPPTCSTFTRPIVTLIASPNTIGVGGSSTLTWSSTYATSCVAAGGFSTGGATSGSVSTGALFETAYFQITCSNGGFTTSIPATATVIVLQPDVTISANPTRVQTGSNVIISWSSSQTISCAVKKNGVAWKTGLSSSGTTDTNVTSKIVYTITCQTNGSPITKSVTVNVVPDFQEF